jgi:hypothetical protein
VRVILPIIRPLFRYKQHDTGSYPGQRERDNEAYSIRVFIGQVPADNAE